MNRIEKGYAIFAILFALGLMTLLALAPETRRLHTLLPLGLLGLLVNVGLMFVVFRDIFLRPTLDQTRKLAWTAAVLVFWPAVLAYLPLHGFHQRG